MKEVWKDIKGYEGLYQVSNLGGIRSLNKFVNTKGKSKRLIKGKTLTPFCDKNGYLLVNLYDKDNKVKQFRTHRLIAETFIPNPNNLPEVNHIDENKQNNCIENLEWCTTRYNCNYGTRNERIRKKVCQYDLNGNYIKTWDSIIQVEKDLNIFHSRIIEVCKNKRNQIGGYIWKYESEVVENELQDIENGL